MTLFVRPSEPVRAENEAGHRGDTGTPDSPAERLCSNAAAASSELQYDQEEPVFKYLERMHQRGFISLREKRLVAGLAVLRQIKREGSAQLWEHIESGEVAAGADFVADVDESRKLMLTDEAIYVINDAVPEVLDCLSDLPIKCFQKIAEEYLGTAILESNVEEIGNVEHARQIIATSDTAMRVVSILKYVGQIHSSLSRKMKAWYLSMLNTSLQVTFQMENLCSKRETLVNDGVVLYDDIGVFSERADNMAVLALSANGAAVYGNVMLMND